MEYLLSNAPRTDSQKFGKNGSFSSVKTDLSLSPEAEPSRRRLPEVLKRNLINLITNQNYKIKTASSVLGISYSTAKKILAKFRKSKKAKGDVAEAKHQCGYMEVQSQSQKIWNRVEVSSTTGGERRNGNIILILNN